MFYNKIDPGIKIGPKVMTMTTTTNTDRDGDDVSKRSL